MGQEESSAVRNECMYQHFGVSFLRRSKKNLYNMLDNQKQNPNYNGVAQFSWFSALVTGFPALSVGCVISHT